MKITDGIECDPFKLACSECGIINDRVWNLPYRCSRCLYGKKRSPIFIKMRLFALERDCFKCCVCNKISGLEVHHIDKDYHNNKLDNLMTLCRRCHGFMHRSAATKNKKINKRRVKEEPRFFIGV